MVVNDMDGDEDDDDNTTWHSLYVAVLLSTKLFKVIEHEHPMT